MSITATATGADPRISVPRDLLPFPTRLRSWIVEIGDQDFRRDIDVPHAISGYEDQLDSECSPGVDRCAELFVRNSSKTLTVPDEDQFSISIASDVFERMVHPTVGVTG